MPCPRTRDGRGPSAGRFSRVKPPWTDFIMQDCEKINCHRWAAALLALVCLGEALAEFKVAEVQPRFAPQSLVLAGQLDLGLNAKVEEALAKGIPLEIAIEVNLYRERRLLWDSKIATWTLPRRPQHHPPSRPHP